MGSLGVARVEEGLGDRTLLLNLDEYEKLGKAIAEGRLDKRFLQLVRSLSQSRPRLVFLLSGAHGFDELDPIWSDNFIHAHLLRVGHLNREETVELITRPADDFPDVYDADAVEGIWTLAAGHPFLTQLLCQTVIRRANEDSLKRVPRSLVTAVAAEIVTEEVVPYFHDLWAKELTDAARTVLVGVAEQNGVGASRSLLESKVGADAGAALALLLRREVMLEGEDGYSFKVPLVGMWVARKAGLPLPAAASS
ncbi:MAG: hypothetical protein HYZ53_19410 [Planctomycetes bacterium]|nr:hypothetical protein [Planctomycetota bacterium]